MENHLQQERKMTIFKNDKSRTVKNLYSRHLIHNQMKNNKTKRERLPLSNTLGELMIMKNNSQSHTTQLLCKQTPQIQYSVKQFLIQVENKLAYSLTQEIKYLANFTKIMIKKIAVRLELRDLQTRIHFNRIQSQDKLVTMT